MNISKQTLPIFLTVFTFGILSLTLFLFIRFLNLFPLSAKIIPQLRTGDMLIGLTIYIKTSVDFALFIGNLMSKNPGTKNRIAIEIGTAFGNAAGTIFVLTVWVFFKEVPFLMITMIFLASLVLFGMAQEGIEEFVKKTHNTLAEKLLLILKQINKISSLFIRFILPHDRHQSAAKKTFLSLLFFSFTIPLILGLDDFAGYIPLFSIVNVFGFTIGVFFGHMLLNIALFASPKYTEQTVRQPIVAFLGSLAFLGIGAWGFVEIYHLLTSLF